MARGWRVPQTSGQSKETDRVKPLKVGDNLINFNFKYFDDCHDFRIDGENRNITNLVQLIKRVKEVSCHTRRQFHTSHSEAFRSHKIDFINHKVTRRTFGVPQPTADDEAYQFSITRSRGRVHGFFISDTFYVVWVDIDHALYPGT